MLPVTAPAAAWATLHMISWAAAPCCSTGAAIEVAMALISPMRPLMPWPQRGFVAGTGFVSGGWRQASSAREKPMKARISLSGAAVLTALMCLPASAQGAFPYEGRRGIIIQNQPNNTGNAPGPRR